MRTFYNFFYETHINLDLDTELFGIWFLQYFSYFFTAFSCSLSDVMDLSLCSVNVGESNFSQAEVRIWQLVFVWCHWGSWQVDRNLLSHCVCSFMQSKWLSQLAGGLCLISAIENFELINDTWTRYYKDKIYIPILMNCFHVSMYIIYFH